MQPLAATSFDRYARYSYVHRLRQDSMPDGVLRILDVGDPYGTLAALFPDDLTVSLDLFEEDAARDEGHQHVIGSGFELPFPDGAFDLVTCHDVLEHIDDATREAFVDELVRVAAGPVVLVAPFADPRATRCEDLVNSYYVARVGSSLAPLDEHADAGLPELERILAHLEARRLPTVVYRDGWLFHWLAFMLLKAHYVSVGAAALDRATDAAFNRLLRTRDQRAPHYRRAIVIRPPDGVPESTPVPGDGDVQGDLDTLSQLAIDLVRALPRGSDPSVPGSTFRTWLESARSASDERVAFLAESVATALDEARRILDAAVDLPAVAGTRADAPSVTALVLRGPDEAIERIEASLRDQGVDEVVRCVQGGDDLALQVAHAVEAARGDAVLIVDPAIALPEDAVRRLLDAYEPATQTLCVGYHVPPDAGPPAAARLHADADAVLYVAAELLLVEKSLYRNVGGFDGSLGRALAPVDLGWRLNLLGYRVRTVGAATWSVATSHDHGGVVAMWLKNLQESTLRRMLAGDLLAALARTSGGGLDDVVDNAESVFAARAAVQKLRAVEDAVLLERFGPVTLPPPRTAAEAAFEAVLEAALPSTRPTVRTRTAALVVADDAAPGRAASLATALADECDATLAVGAAAALDAELPARVTVVRHRGPDDLAKLAEHVDVVVVPAAVLAVAPGIGSSEAVVVVDLATAGLARDPAVDRVALRRGDAFVCDSEVQRAHWLGRIAGQGRLLAEDDVDGLVAVVPAAAASVPSRRGRRVDVVIDIASPVSSNLDQGGVRAAVEAAAPGTRVIVVPADASAAERARSLGTARLVVRLAAADTETSLTSTSGAADALVAGAPIVTTIHDPASHLVAATRAGIVARDESELASAVSRLLADPGLEAAASVSAASVGASLVGPAAAARLRDIVRRPWKWEGAHLGGAVADLRRGPVAELLALREAEAMRTVERTRAAIAADQLAAAVAERDRKLAEARDEMRRLQDEVAAERARADRIRKHPVVRVLARLRRLLLAP